MSDAEQLAQQAAERIRELVSEAERRAAEIVEAAEREAAQIRERAEREAREGLERARRALAELAGDDPPRSEPPVAGTSEPVSRAPESEPESPEPPVAETPEPGPPAPEPGRDGADDDAARLVAMKMALDGSTRDQIDAELRSRFGASDRSELLDDVLTRARR